MADPIASHTSIRIYPGTNAGGISTIGKLAPLGGFGAAGRHSIFANTFPHPTHGSFVAPL